MCFHVLNRLVHWTGKCFTTSYKLMLFSLLLDPVTIPVPVTSLSGVFCRDPEQAFVFYTMKSPPFIRNIEKRLHFAKFNGLINWTMSYRSDADVFFSYLRTESLLDFLQRNHSIDEIILKKKNVAVSD